MSNVDIREQFGERIRAPRQEPCTEVEMAAVLTMDRNYLADTETDIRPQPDDSDYSQFRKCIVAERTKAGWCDLRFWGASELEDDPYWDWTAARSWLRARRRERISWSVRSEGQP